MSGALAGSALDSVPVDGTPLSFVGLATFTGMTDTFCVGPDQDTFMVGPDLELFTVRPDRTGC